MTTAPAWTDSEIDSLIGLYLSMRILAARGVPYVKAQIIREAIGAPTPAQPDGNPSAPLVGRTRQSVEFKMMNLTAALESIGRDDLSMAEHGYRPMANYQAALKQRAVALVAGYELADLDRVIERCVA